MTDDGTGAGSTPGEPTQPIPAEPTGATSAAPTAAGAAAAGAAAGATPPPGSPPPPGGTVPPDGPTPWYKNPTVLIVGALVAIAAIVILIVALSGDDDEAASVTSDSTTTTVETTVPETTTPETTTPETTTPETTTPETTTPETTTPETTTPETTTPEATTPETTAPETSVPDVTVPEGGGSLVAILSGNEDLSIVWGLIQEAGLDVVLEASPGPYTVFAPTNDAFEGVTPPTGDDLVNLITLHVVVDSLDSGAVLAETELPTLSGQMLAVDADALTVGGAKILVVDLEGTEAPVGYLHVVDAILTATS